VAAGQEGKIADCLRKMVLLSSRKAGVRLAIWCGSSNAMKLHAVDIAIILGYFLTVMCLTALPIYLVLRNWSWVGAIVATLAVTTLTTKFNWCDKLGKAP
jgi:hypothetical protein